jgi:putative ribosome biogenesis GTPase RsgA
VLVNLENENTGAIEEIEERERALVRTAPTARGFYKQFAANPDQASLYLPVPNPNPDLRILDRFW